jgi:small subunit ribosomal protein S4
VVAVRQRMRESEYVSAMQEELTEKTVPAWLSLDRENLRGHVARFPERDEIDTPVNEQLVVEYYSR